MKREVKVQGFQERLFSPIKHSQWRLLEMQPPKNISSPVRKFTVTYKYRVFLVMAFYRTGHATAHALQPSLSINESESEVAEEREIMQSKSRRTVFLCHFLRRPGVFWGGGEKILVVSH